MVPVGSWNTNDFIRHMKFKTSNNICKALSQYPTILSGIHTRNSCQFRPNWSANDPLWLIRNFSYIRLWNVHPPLSCFVVQDVSCFESFCSRVLGVFCGWTWYQYLRTFQCEINHWENEWKIHFDRGILQKNITSILSSESVDIRTIFYVIFRVSVCLELRKSFRLGKNVFLSRHNEEHRPASNTIFFVPAPNVNGSVNGVHGDGAQVNVVKNHGKVKWRKNVRLWTKFHKQFRDCKFRIGPLNVIVSEPMLLLLSDHSSQPIITNLQNCIHCYSD